VDFEYAKILDAIFSGQSLLLSTTVLNDCNDFMSIFTKKAKKSGGT